MKGYKSKRKNEGPEYRPGVEIGDYIYFQCADGPRTGRVRARGKHGCTIDCDGEQHKVRWDKVLGHKKRARQRYTILDEGEDGLIVQDAAGQRRYLSIPPDAGEDRLMTKAIELDGRVVVFAKAKGSGSPFVGRPGLTKKQIVDRTGRRQTKWVRTDKEQPREQRRSAPDEATAQRPRTEQDRPSLQAGDKVQFDTGEFSGSGEVVGTPGADGFYVRDSSGRKIQVRYDEIKQQAEKSTDDVSQGVGKPQSADDIARALFNTSELEKLPSKASQPVRSWEDLVAKAPEALDQFKGFLGEVAKTLGLETGKIPKSYNLAQEEENEKAKKEGREPKKLSPDEYMLPEDWENERGYLFIGPLKKEDRAREKVEAEYEGDWSQLRDMVRATIAVPMVTQLPKVLRELEAAGMELAQKPKNNLVKPLPGGYRDINMIIKLPNGMLAELQLHVKPMTLAKEIGHTPYETSRSIVAKYVKQGLAGHKEEWDPMDRENYDKAMAEQEAIYGEAWKKATEVQSNLTKSMRSCILFLRG